MDEKKHLSVRIDPVLLKKFRSVAAYNDRSANSEILRMIRQSVRAFEAEHGEIHVDVED